MSRKIFKATIVLCLTFIGVACSSTATRIKTEPSGAKIYINGELVGKSPTVYFGKASGGRRYHVQIEKQGYEDLDFYLDNSMIWWAPASLLFPYGGAIYLYLNGWALLDEYQFNLRVKSLIEPAATQETENSINVQEISEEDAAAKQNKPETAMEELDEATKDSAPKDVDAPEEKPE